jgi:RNA polymerase sigma factor (sigma-70 family)
LIGPKTRVAATAVGLEMGGMREEVGVEEIAEQAPALLAAARLLLGNDADARDLAQATIEIGLRRRSTLRAPDRLLAWLLVIQTREAFRWRRRLRRFVSVGNVRDVSPPPADADDTIALREALRRLPARIRAAVVLRHMVGLSVAETAAAMGVSTNTAKSQLKRGLELLRQDLA